MKRAALFVFLFVIFGLFHVVDAQDAVTPYIVPVMPDLFSVPEEPKEFLFDESEAHQTSPPEPKWTYVLPIEILDDPNDFIRLVNKINLLDEKYPPDDDLHQMVDANVRKTSKGERMVRTIVNDALKVMFETAEDEGIRLYLQSAYRSFRTQRTIYANNLEKYNGVDHGIVQAPGASEHQTGLAVDVISRDWINKALNERFAQTKEGQWLAANCSRFGFIIRYPEGKREITGIMYEPWHLRFVGIEVAKYLMETGLTLEEFTEEWRAELYSYQSMANSNGNAAWTGEFVFTEVKN